MSNTNEERHFCVTSYIFNPTGTKTALIKHKKLGLYFGAGGHIEANEDYFEAAKRELLEETGLSKAIYPDYLNPENLGTKQPYRIQKNCISKGHFHYDLLFAAIVTEEDDFKPGEGESTDIQWFDIEKINDCHTSEETRQVVKEMSSIIQRSNLVEQAQKDIYLYPRYQKSLKIDLAQFTDGVDFNSWNLGGIYEEVPFSYAQKMGAEYGIFCSTGTAGLHASLIALGLKPGDEVIVPSMTFIRAATPLNHLQLQPVIADIDPITGNIDPQSIHRVISKKTKAVIVVHMWGVPADCQAIRDICDQNGLKMIEDFSHAHYSMYGDRFVGSYGDASFCSLQRKKLLSVGEGGLIVTSDPEVFDRLKHITSPGSFVDQSNYSGVDFSGFGLNMRMSPFSAVVAKNIYNQIDQLIQTRRENLRNLTSMISQTTDKIQLPILPEYTDFNGISWYSYKPRLNGISLQELKKLELWKFGDMGYSPIATHRYWQKDNQLFPFVFGIKPIIRDSLVGHEQYMSDRISLNITSIDPSYWTQETRTLWMEELSKIN